MWFFVPILLGSGNASAPLQPMPVTIEFAAPAGCSDPASFFQGVHARTDRVRWAAEGEAGLRMRVRLTRAAGAIQGELRFVDEHGETETRKVDGATCEEVVQALSLTAALAVDPFARLSLPTQPSSPPSASSAAPATSETPRARANEASRPPAPASSSSAPAELPWSAETTPQAARARGWGLEVGAQAVVSEIVARSGTLGGSVIVRFDDNSGGWSPSFSVAATRMQSEGLVGASDVAIELNAGAVTVCPSGWILADRFTLRPCAWAAGGQLSVAGRSVEHSLTATTWWWSVAGLLRVQAEIFGGLFVDLELGIGAPLVRRRFTVAFPDKEVGATPGVMGLGAIGLGYRFGL